MQIGPIDMDSHNFPNLALMKLSAWHKAQGDAVEWWWGFGQYDRVYMSKACAGILRRAERRGKKLPPELEAALLAQCGACKETP